MWKNWPKIIWRRFLGRNGNTWTIHSAVWICTALWRLCWIIVGSKVMAGKRSGEPWFESWELRCFGFLWKQAVSIRTCRANELVIFNYGSFCKRQCRAPLAAKWNFLKIARLASPKDLSNTWCSAGISPRIVDAGGEPVYHGFYWMLGIPLLQRPYYPENAGKFIFSTTQSCCKILALSAK